MTSHLPRIAPDGTFVGSTLRFPTRLLSLVPTQRSTSAPGPERGDRALLGAAEFRVLTDGRPAVVVDTLLWSVTAHGQMRPALVLGPDGDVEAWLGEQKLSGRNAHVLWERIAVSQNLPLDLVKAQVLAALSASADLNTA